MFMKAFTSQTYAALRIVSGFTYVAHGVQKVMLIPGGDFGPAPAWVIYIGGPIELIGGLSILLGLYTRWGAFLSSGMMAAAYWLGHGLRGIAENGAAGLLPVVNGGELAAVYCFLFLFIAAQGPGAASLDRKLGIDPS